MKNIENEIRTEIMKGKILEAALEFRNKVGEIIKEFKEETNKQEPFAAGGVIRNNKK